MVLVEDVQVGMVVVEVDIPVQIKFAYSVIGPIIFIVNDNEGPE